jgi:hypothetical protein
MEPRHPGLLPVIEERMRGSGRLRVSRFTWKRKPEMNFTIRQAQQSVPRKTSGFLPAAGRKSEKHFLFVS